MSRRIVELGVLRSPGGRVLLPERQTVRADTRFGNRYTDLGHYLASKYGIHRDNVTGILSDIFRYIEMETLQGERGIFTVPRFGRFERRDVNHGEYNGGTHTSTVMRFTRSAVRRGGTYIDWEDPEWVEEDEDE